MDVDKTIQNPFSTLAFVSVGTTTMAVLGLRPGQREKEEEDTDFSMQKQQ